KTVEDFLKNLDYALKKALQIVADKNDKNDKHLTVEFIAMAENIVNFNQAIVSNTNENLNNIATMEKENLANLTVGMALACAQIEANKSENEVKDSIARFLSEVKGLDKENEKIKSLVEIINKGAKEVYQIIKNPNLSDDEKNQKINETINKAKEEAKEKELTYCGMNRIVPVRSIA
ncbi:MAG: hypothetical protein QXO21_03160, partial [Candidatus Anstonellales archaeon]